MSAEKYINDIKEELNLLRDEHSITQELMADNIDQTNEKIDKIFQEFKYLHNNSLRFEEMRIENKHYYDSLTSKIHFFFGFYVLTALILKWFV